MGPAEHLPQNRPLSPAMILLVQGAAVSEAIQSRLSGIGLNLRQLAILGHLARNPGLSFTELASRAKITVQSMHSLVHNLTEHGLITGDHPTRGRSAKLSLSKTGRERLRAAQHIISEVDITWFGPAAEPSWQALGNSLTAVDKLWT